jgi:hypothetical protein
MSRYVLETGMIKPPDPKEKKDKILKPLADCAKDQSQKRNFAQANQSPISDPKAASKVESASKKAKADDSPITKGLSSKVTSMRVCRLSARLIYVSLL